MRSIPQSKTPIVYPQFRTVKQVQISHLMRVVRQIPIVVTLLQFTERKIPKNSTRLKKPHIMVVIRQPIQSKVLFWKMEIKTIFFSHSMDQKKSILHILMIRKTPDMVNLKMLTETQQMTHISTQLLIALIIGQT